ncbi:hypothetical protein HJG54_26260 [Leptolyngbya sp. NK1-12]|uniref:Uncharacterized protein n=1 Tax=Leptolyngbya sp. NK1-12 TaxID=2547451 RepID=A0AA96WNP8_9CYAN|nr:hypothetical protein [Leptolyngbya sp. NK1-12]WNZ25986.1 hypothetical protein HJG54_26260 [Leptolyngbya sp. NK1-12]
MDSLQDQVFALNIKVDALRQTLEQLGDQTAEILSFVKQLGADSDHGAAPDLLARQTYHAYQSRTVLNSGMEHKDILSDTTYPDDSQSGDHSLAPEVQIQRLTAQLTAAYNRIAALEEQLLAKRLS